MAPEAIRNKSYSIKSDVYSFGIVIWELVARSAPYPDLDPVNTALAVISENLRPSIPENCDPTIAKIMTDCWQSQPEKRPDFGEICSMLDKSLSALGFSSVRVKSPTANRYGGSSTPNQSNQSFHNNQSNQSFNNSNQSYTQNNNNQSNQSFSQGSNSPALPPRNTSSGGYVAMKGGF
jgi:hypothetical protein